MSEEMTKEQAVERLKNKTGILTLTVGGEKTIETVIKALEEEPCSDTVTLTSKQYHDLVSALEQEKGAYNALVKSVQCEDAISRQNVRDMLRWLSVEMGDAIYERLADITERLPSVCIEPMRWIPVTEKLPEEPYGCLVTVIDTEPMTMTDFENILPYFVGYDGERWNDWEGEQCPFEVIAWMPLPKPYESEEQE